MTRRQGILVWLIAACLVTVGCGKSTDEEEFDPAEMARNAEPFDIWLAEVDFSGAEAAIGDIVNITNRPGYDNQPQFLPSGDGILYTSIRDEYQSDVWLYDIASGTHTQITDTTEYEFSPTPMPSGDGFSTVRVEKDSSQRLWHFSMDGSSSQVILPDVEKVGYHSWIDGNRVAMITYNEGLSSLQVGWVNYDESHVVAERVERSFSRSPVADEMVFTSWPEEWSAFESEEDWKAAMEKGDWQMNLSRMDIEEWQAQPLTAGRVGSIDFCWTPQGDLLMAEGSKLYRYVMDIDEWQMVADFEDRLDGNKIQRLTVSPGGNLLAMTVAEKGGHSDH